MSTQNNAGPGARCSNPNQESESMNTDFVAQFGQAMREEGLEITDPINADGQLHRFTPGGGHGPKTGWYVLHVDAPGPTAVFGCWKADITAKWSANIGREYSPEEKSALKRRVATDRVKKHRVAEAMVAEAKARALSIWRACQPCPPAHPYLVRKGIGPGNARLYKDLVTLPVEKGGEVVGLQFISADGKKNFLSGTPKRGASTVIGGPVEDSLIICEGHATGATLHQATATPVMVAFDAGNLEPVARAARQRWPELKIMIAADDDRWTTRNPGIQYAGQAAAAVSA